MENEVTIEQEVRPSDEQATAFLNGDRTAVEPQTQAPAPKQEPAPAASTAPPAQTPNELAEIRAELNRLKSENGQFRRLQSEMSRKQTEQKPQVPQAWAQMTPEQREQMQELVDHAWRQKYGQEWEATRTERQELQIQRQIGTIENLAKQYAGDLYPQLDPIMGRIYGELREKAMQGDEEAADIVEEIRTTRSGVRYLVDLSKQEYSQSIEQKGAEAVALKDAKAKKAGVTLGQTPTQAQKPSVLDNLPSDPAKAAEILREELKRRGAL